MDENLNNIEDIFRNGLEDNEEIPSTRVWNGIGHIISNDKVISMQKKYSVLKSVALLLLFLLLGLSLYEISSRQKYRQLVNRNNLQQITEPVYHSSSHPLTAPDARSAKPTGAIMPQQKTNKTIARKTPAADDSAVPKNATAKPQNNLAIALTNKPLTGKKPLPEAGTSSPARTPGNLQLPAKNEGRERWQLHRAAIGKINGQMAHGAGIPMVAYPLAPTQRFTPQPPATAVVPSVKKKAGKLSRFSISPFFSPDIAWYRLQKDQPDNQPDNLNDIKRGEEHDFSSTAGALVDYALTHRWSLQSGLAYSTTNITLDPKTIYAQPDNSGNIKYRINTSSGYGYVLPSFSSNPAIGDSLYVFTSTHTLQYISIPLSVTYTLTTGRVSFHASAGIAVNVLTRGKIESLVEKGVNNETEVVDNLHGLRKLYFSALTGIGAEYQLNRHTAIFFAPAFRLALNAINRNAPVKSYPNTCGLAFGLHLKL